MLKKMLNGVKVQSIETFSALARKLLQSGHLSKRVLKYCLNLRDPFFILSFILPDFFQVFFDLCFMVKSANTITPATNPVGNPTKNEKKILL